MTGKSTANIPSTETTPSPTPATIVPADDKSKQMQDMTNNKATTAQKAADKMDAYIRS